MRISDWSSDVCSSDLLSTSYRKNPSQTLSPRPPSPTRFMPSFQSPVPISGRPRPPNRSSARCSPRTQCWYSVSADARSEEHTSELQSLMRISYAVFCLKKKKTTNHTDTQDIYE